MSLGDNLLDGLFPHTWAGAQGQRHLSSHLQGALVRTLWGSTPEENIPHCTHAEVTPAGSWRPSKVCKAVPLALRDGTVPG